MSAKNDVVLNEKIKVSTANPKKYKVIFLNDDTTPMEFVVSILIDIFKHSEKTATDVTVQIHTEGSGVVGVYNYEIAEQKAAEVVTISRNHGFQLQVRLEEE